MSLFDVEPGIYFGMPEADYHAARGLSCSGAKKLAISPLHYWHHVINPNRRPVAPSPQMLFGSAVHCRLLEPGRFAEAYAPKFSPTPDALDTMDEMRAWLAERNLPTKAKRKQDLIDRIVATGEPAVIAEVEEENYAVRHGGKTVLSRDDWERVDRLASVVGNDPHAAGLLAGGVPEVSFFVVEPGAGVLLKSRMDMVQPHGVVDVKTFTNARDKPIGRALAEIICYEQYHLQHCWYSRVRALAAKQLVAGEIRTHGGDGFGAEFLFSRPAPAFHFLFVESTEPHEVRIVEMERSEAPGGPPNIYWSAASALMDDMIDRFNVCATRWGDHPWRESRPARRLLDSDLPQFMFA